MRAGNKVRIGVLSAHQGANYWVKLVEYLNAQGKLDLISLHSFNDAHYRRNGGQFQRLFLRLEIYLIYPLRCIFLLLTQQKHYDGFLAVSSPFFLPALCSLLSTKPTIALQNDLYPEALVLAHIINRGSIAESILQRIARVTVKRSDSLVYICMSHKAFAERNLGANPSTHVIPVGADGRSFKSHPPQSEASPVTLLYCGTLGRMHDPSTIVEYLNTCPLPKGCRFVFRTSGAGKAALESQLRDAISRKSDLNNLTWGDALGAEEWVHTMLACQVGMVFQAPGAENVIFPSKAFSILMAGQAMLAITPTDSELGKLILENDCGWVVSPNNIQGLAKALEEIMVPEILLRKRQNAFTLGHRSFDVSSLATIWSEVLLAACQVNRSPS